MNETFWDCLSAVVTMLTGALFVCLLVADWRLPPAKNRRIVAALVLTIAAVQVAAFCLLDLNTANVAATVADAAALLVPALLARGGRGRLLFSVTAAYSFTFSTVFLAYFLSPTCGPVDLAVRVAAAAFIGFLLRRWFAPCLHGVFRIDISGWYGLTLIPLLFGMMSFTLVMGTYSTDGAEAVGSAGMVYGLTNAALYCVLLLLPPCTYIVFYQFFERLQRQYGDYRERAALIAKVSALENQRAMGERQQERDARFNRSLLRWLEDIKTLTQAGELSESLQRAEALEGQVASELERTSCRYYAESPILDAVFQQYAALAEEADVAFSAAFALPENLEIDPIALAVALSNALENALRACRGQRNGRPPSIRLFTRNTPGQLFLQIENTCGGPVAFDSATGYPIATDAGHGYGTRSIAAFVRQYHGTLQYSCRDGMFRLQMLI